MGYYDGNTVTALWNYAQYFAMSDNFFDTEFGVTEEGHQNLIAGQTNTSTGTSISGKVVNGSIIANVEAGVDDCVTPCGEQPRDDDQQEHWRFAEYGRNHLGLVLRRFSAIQQFNSPSPAPNALRLPAVKL